VAKIWTKDWTKDELVEFLKTNPREIETLDDRVRHFFYSSKLSSSPLSTVFDLLGAVNFTSLKQNLRPSSDKYRCTFTLGTLASLDEFLSSMGLSRNMHTHLYDPAVSREIITQRGDVDASSTLQTIERFAERVVMKQFLLADIMDDTHGIKTDNKDLENETLNQLMEMGVELNLELLFHFGCDVRQDKLSATAIKLLDNHLGQYGLKLGDLKRDSFKTPFTKDKTNAEELVNEVLDRILGKAEPVQKPAASPVDLPTVEDFRALASPVDTIITTPQAIGSAQLIPPPEESTTPAQPSSKRWERDELITFLKAAPWDVLELTTKVTNHLINEGLFTVFGLLGKKEAELLRIYLFGRKSLNMMKEELFKVGLKLGMHEVSSGHVAILHEKDHIDGSDLLDTEIAKFVDEFLGTKAPSLKPSEAFKAASLLTQDDYNAIGSSINYIFNTGAIIEETYLEELLSRDDIKIELNNALVNALEVAVQHVAKYLSNRSLTEMGPQEDKPESEKDYYGRFTDFFINKLSDKLSRLKPEFVKALAHERDEMTDVIVACRDTMQSCIMRAVANDLNASLK
jgi:hypothetical protein